jgi:hypothetical protein
MTSGRRVSLLRGRLLAVLVGVGLLAQLALPAVHAIEVERGSKPEAASVLPGAAEGPSVAANPVATPAHDPATCPACQSLLRTSPVVAPNTVSAQPDRGHPSALPAAPALAISAVARTGHPPRAPPIPLLS